MKKTILAVMLALALVLIPVSSALAVDVEVYATPATISFTATPNWTVNGIAGSGEIWPNTTYYANNSGDKTEPHTGANAIVDGDCFFTFDNGGTTAIAITCNMSNFSNGTDAMVNNDEGYDGTVDPGEFGASGYVSGETWPDDAEPFLTSLSNVFISSLGEDGGGSDTIMWGVALTTQPDDFTDTTPTTSIITCTASEP
jgi:hypothetical protein